VNSFKSKMDEIIKNFCQYWPIYDLPFELVSDDLRAADTGKDTVDGMEESAEEPVGKAAAADNSRSNSNSNGACGGRLPRVPTETIFVDEISATNEHVAANSYPLITYWKSTESPASGRCEGDRGGEKVDILILLPQIEWLDEWSDLDARSRRQSY